MTMKESDEARFERYKNELVAIIQKTLPGCKIYLFGSRAKKTHRSGADIDIALDNAAPIAFDDLLHLYGEIEQTTIPLEVDLVDMHTATDEMKAQIDVEKILWAV